MNPLVRGVEVILHANGFGHLLDRRWLSDGPLPHQALPMNLSAMLSEGGLSGLGGQLLAGGVVLTPEQPGGTPEPSGPKILLRGRRVGNYDYMDSQATTSASPHVDGPAHRLGNEQYQLTATLLHGRPERAITDAPERRTRTIRMREQVIVPDRAVPSVPPVPPPRVRELRPLSWPGQQLKGEGVRSLAWSADELRDGRVEVLGMRPEALRELASQVLPRMSGEADCASVDRVQRRGGPAAVAAHRRAGAPAAQAVDRPDQRRSRCAGAGPAAAAAQGPGAHHGR